MAKVKISWEEIPSSEYMHGYRAIVDNRRVELVQTDSCNSTWAAFCYLDGRMVKGDGKSDSDYLTARKKAVDFLHKVVPDELIDAWPKVLYPSQSWKRVAVYIGIYKIAQFHIEPAKGATYAVSRLPDGSAASP